MAKNIYRDPRETLKRSKEAWKIKDFWKGIHQECYDLALAGVSPYQGNKKAPRVMNRQFDSTAPNAVVKLVNRIVNDMTPPEDSWVNIAVGPILERKYSAAQLEQLKTELDGVSAITNMVVNQNELVSTRYMAVLDLVISGIGCMLNLEDHTDDVSPVNSQSVSQSEVAIEEDARGRIAGIYRKRMIKIRDIKFLWSDAVIPEELTDISDKTGDDPEIEVLESTYAVPGGNRRGANVPPWAYEVLYENKGDKPSVIVARPYNENPWTILRWLVLPGCPYGPGPVMLALADIRVANKIVEMILQNAALALSGMYLVRDDGVVNPDNIQITNGGFIPVQSTAGPLGASIAPLDPGRSFDVGGLILEEYQMRIKKWLFDNGLPADSGAPKSATEIINRVRELTADLGAGIGRLAGDLVDYIRRIVGILVRRGVIPFPIMLDQFTLKVQINSPLARAQQLQKVQTVIQWLETILNIGGEQALTIVAKIPEIMVWIADQMGVPSRLVNNEAERLKAQDSLAAIQAQGALPQQV